MLVTKFTIDKSKRCTTAWLNLRILLTMQFFTYKVMFENSGLTTRRTAMRVHCENTSLSTTFWLTWMCSHENVLIEARVGYNLSYNFLLCSTDMFPCSVSTTRRIHARVHTLKDGCLYTFWLTKLCTQSLSRVPKPAYRHVFLRRTCLTVCSHQAQQWLILHLRCQKVYTNTFS